MKWIECKELIVADLFQLTGKNKGSQIGCYFDIVNKLIMNASFKVTFWFRLGSYFHSKRGILIKPVYLIAKIIYRHYQYKTGCQLYLGTKVGGGLIFPHWGSQIIHNNAVLGENIMIYQDVTIGSLRGRGGAPKIGDNVVLFSGAKIIGDITIGDNCVIGAGAVVTKDVPSGYVAAGVPAKLISKKGEEIVERYLIRYN